MRVERAGIEPATSGLQIRSIIQQRWSGVARGARCALPEVEGGLHAARLVSEF
jgi:hypothetical protein